MNFFLGWKFMLIGYGILIIHISAEAKTFGMYGHTFEIKEEGFLEMIQRNSLFVLDNAFKFATHRLFNSIN